MRLGGSVISARDEQPAKALHPISVRVGGSVISVSDVQPAKAHHPILVSYLPLSITVDPCVPVTLPASWVWLGLDL